MIATTMLLAGCTQAGLVGAPVGGKAVTFTLAVDPAAFSDKRQITVSIYDADQLALMESTAGCSVSYDVATGQEKTSCPPGVTYRKPAPETMTTTKAELAKGLTLASKSVTVGERYRVSVGGMASDDCNSASATAEGTAATETVSLANLPVAQTEMACVPTR